VVTNELRIQPRISLGALVNPDCGSCLRFLRLSEESLGGLGQKGRCSRSSIIFVYQRWTPNITLRVNHHYFEACGIEQGEVKSCYE
jgi:hypothetical protein